MSIVIRHGSNGAMKSATAVDAYIIPAIKEGRTVVTNLRGFTLERCYEVFPDLPETLDVINVDDGTEEGKALISKWFHWVPKGALLVFDEASSLFPKSWREKDIAALDYPGGIEAATRDDRPPNWLIAWEKQRHWNWDIVLTTPNIKGIRDDIRGTTEMAYRHRSLGKISEKFRVIKEVQHDAQKNGFSVSDAISVSTRHVSRKAFKLYDSTATGIHQGSQAGKKLLSDPRLLLLGTILLVVFAVVLRNGTPEVLSGPDQARHKPSQTSAQSRLQNAEGNRPLRAEANSASVRADAAHPVLQYQRPEDFPLNDPFGDYHLAIVGSINDRTQIEASLDGDVLFLNPAMLSELGYTYFPITDCLGKLVSGNKARLITCASNDKRRLQADGRSSGSSTNDDTENSNAPARGA